MGVSGVEGVFRRCCEETLSVMRTNKEALLTIVEVWLISQYILLTMTKLCTFEFLTVFAHSMQVFIHDPLYKWALSPLKALQRQKVYLSFTFSISDTNKCNLAIF